MTNPETLTPRQEPELVIFLKNNQLYTDIVGGKIQAIAIDRKSPEFKVTKRFITAEDLDSAGDWVEQNAPELHEDPLFHLNMKNLRPLRHVLFLATKS